MHQTIGRITGKPGDYKKCPACHAINWYENDTCVNCDHPLRIATALEFTEEDVDQLLQDYTNEYGFLDDEIELEV